MQREPLPVRIFNYRPAKLFQSGQFAAVVLLLGMTTLAHAQWQIQSAGTTANLRGIHAVDDQIAWASGTHGTVLRTLDGGSRWQNCSVPTHGSTLDFRSIWAWDADHAMVMSSGPGQQSRLYSTHDGCKSWRMVFLNPDTDGFWDALQFEGSRFGVILGDPVHGRFTLFVTFDGGSHWTRQVDNCLRTMERNQGAFAASNQSLVILPLQDAGSSGGAINHQVLFGTSGGWLYGLPITLLRLVADEEPGCEHMRILPPGPEKESQATTGVFAIAFQGMDGVAVGGDFARPKNLANTAAYTVDGQHWHAALQPPAGFRSTVAWNPSDGSWLAAGPNGSDISRDGAKTWQPLGAGPANSTAWNALSLPFAVGSNGRIGRLISWGQLRADSTPTARITLRAQKD